MVKTSAKAAKISEPISPLRISKQRSAYQKGFTLIEIMVVLIIVGIFMVFGARKLVDRNTETRASVRRFTTMMKELRNRARLDNKTYRLVFDLPSKKDDPQSYWIESTSKAALLLNTEEREELSKDLEATTNSETKEKGPPPDPQGFKMDSGIIKKQPANLPDGLFFESIELDGDPIETVNEGRVYIYFFPQGYVQSSAIHITDRENIHWTLAVEGITGRVDIFQKDIPLEEIKNQ